MAVMRPWAGRTSVRWVAAAAERLWQLATRGGSQEGASETERRRRGELKGAILTRRRPLPTRSLGEGAGYYA